MQAKKIANMIIDLLKQQNKLDILPQVIDELQKGTKSNQVVIIQSAHILSSESQKNVEELLEARMGFKPDVRYEVKPELIAGIKIQINDQLIDTTIKQRLEEVFKKIH